VPGQPDEIYASTQVRGLLQSHNGGHTWQSLGTQRNGMPWQGSPLAVDPVTSTRVYLGEQCPVGPCLRISANSGQSWQALTLTVPLTWSGWSGEVFAVAPQPHVPGRILVGATFYPPNFDWSNPSRPAGGIYVSDDFGAHFTYRPTAPISGVVQFAYDAVDPNLVYAGTEGTGLWRSRDGGQTWEPAATGGGAGLIGAVVADPWQPNTVWIGKLEGPTQTEPSNVYSSTDAGETWAPVAWPRNGQNGIRTLLLAPTQPSTLYIGTEGAGLYRTRDAGNSWELLPGVPANGTFYALAAGTDGQRVAVYIGTGGGTATTSVLTVHSPAQAGSAVMGAGVYRLITLLSNPRVYLPFVSRATAR
jgi:BNR/Asp-box repeat